MASGKLALQKIRKSGSSRQSLGAITDTTLDTLLNLKQELRKAVSIGTSLADHESREVVARL